MSYKPWSKEETELIKTHYLAAPKAELLRLLPRRTWQDVTQKAYDLRITGRSFQVDAQRGNVAKYTINMTFLLNGLRAWHMFWAMLSDEILTRLTIVSKDKDHLERINAAIGSNRPLYQRALDNTYYAGAKQTWSLIVASTVVVHHLLRLGIEPNKSISGSYPLVPKEFWWHFFRGILDSDGNILFSPKAGLRITIAGNMKCIMGLHSDLSHLFAIDSQTKHLDEDRVKLLFLYGENAERALMLTYQSSDGLRLERKYNQWLEWNQHFKLMTNCLFCDAPLRASKGEKLCPSCRVIRSRLMNRRSDHHRRKGTWLSLRDLCKPEESHLPVERIDRYID